MPDKPEDLFLTVIVALLTPMFIPLTGDLDRAQLAATAAVRQLQATSGAHLLTIAQFLALNVAVTNTLCLAMNDELDPILAVRLQNSAAALFRCQDKVLRIIDSKPVRPPAPPPEPQDAEDAEAEHQIRLAQRLQGVVKKMSAEHEATGGPLTHPHPSKPGETITVDPKSLKTIHTYAQAAEACINDPAEWAHGSRKEANSRAKLLNSCAYDVLLGKPVDLAALTGFPMPK
jgi:hypothetical protein